MTGKAGLSLPKSPTRMPINLTGVACFLLCLWVMHSCQEVVSLRVAGYLLLLSTCVPIFLLETTLLKTYRNHSTGLMFERRFSVSPHRVLLKLLGLCMTILLFVGYYWILPFYDTAGFLNYFLFLADLLPWFFLVSLPYMVALDNYMVNPEDGYYQTGLLFTGRFARVDYQVFWNHLRGWLIKAFFLPLMYNGLTNNFGMLLSMSGADYAAALSGDFSRFYHLTELLLFTVDLLFVTCGYLLTIRFFDTHIRSAEPTVLGWVVALHCYQPFWGVASSTYLNYKSGPGWQEWLAGTGLYPVWGCAILVLLGVYVWATIPFGMRFSNLTHRGIITNGPYRFCKHPAYVGKNIAWWLISMPFMVDASLGDAVLQSLMLLGVNIIYLLRARTEERHLSLDPDYVAYAEAMEQQSVFRWLGRICPLFKFKAGRLFNLP